MVMIQCKVCDIRDLETARMCCRYGADYLGLHCVNGIPPAREAELRKVARELPREYPHVGIVLVTLETDPAKVASMARVLSPSHIQLHAAGMSAVGVRRIREALSEGQESPKIVAVTKVPRDSLARVEELAEFADMLLADRTHYEEEEVVVAVQPAKYRRVVKICGKLGMPCFIAGGLTPQNVRRYLEECGPWGVDVQSGVELERGKKDPESVRVFIEEVRAHERRDGRRKEDGEA